MCESVGVCERERLPLSESDRHSSRGGVCEAGERIFIELMTSDCELKASREGSK